MVSKGYWGFVVGRSAGGSGAGRAACTWWGSAAPSCSARQLSGQHHPQPPVQRHDRRWPLMATAGTSFQFNFHIQSTDGPGVRSRPWPTAMAGPGAAMRPPVVRKPGDPDRSVPPLTAQGVDAAMRMRSRRRLMTGSSIAGQAHVRGFDRHSQPQGLAMYFSIIDCPELTSRSVLLKGLARR